MKEKIVITEFHMQQNKRSSLKAHQVKTYTASVIRLIITLL